VGGSSYLARAQVLEAAAAGIDKAAEDFESGLTRLH
jgi:hypothetical protein